MIKKISGLVHKYKAGNVASSLMLAFTQSIVAVIFIFIDFVFSKKLDPDRFGAWKQMYFIINLLVPILSFGIPEGYKYYIAKEGRKKEFFSNAVFMFILTTTIGVVVFAILNFLHYKNIVDLKEYYLVSIFFPLGFLVFNLNKSLRYSYINESKVWLNSKIVTLFFIPTCIIIGIITFYINEAIQYYLWIGLLIYILVFGMPVISLNRNLKLKFIVSSIKRIEIRKMLKIGLPLYLATFIGFMVLNIDKGIVALFENKATFAVFAVGAFEIPVFAMLSAAFSQQTYPALVRLTNEGKKQEARELWIKTTLNVSYITFPLIIILMIFAKPILFFIYTNEYNESIVLFQVYLLVGLFRNNYYGALIAASGKTKYITYFTTLTLIVNLLLSCILYFFIGLKGIVYGTLISTFMINMLQLNHEGLLRMYFKKFVLNKFIIIMIAIVLIAFFSPWFSF